MQKKHYLIKKILIAIENEVVIRNNWLRENHNLFDIILTWNDDFIDNKKYFKIMYISGFSQHEQENDFSPFEKKIFIMHDIVEKNYKHKNETQTD